MKRINPAPQCQHGDGHAAAVRYKRAGSRQCQLACAVCCEGIVENTREPLIAERLSTEGAVSTV